MWIWVAVVLVAVALGWWWSQNRVSMPPVSDKTAAIEKDLSAIDLGNVDKELQSTDADVNAL